MDKIDKLYYINLDKRPDRNFHFINECVKAGIPASKIIRFSGLDGNIYNFTLDELNLFNNVDYKNQPFEKKIIGNQLSHYNILKDMVKNNYEYIIICQDDVIFKSNFLFELNNIMNNLPIDAEIINIGFHEYAAYNHFVPWDLNSTNDYTKLGKKKINNYICKLKKTINPCSLAYIVTLKGAINLINYFTNTGFLRATDWNYNDYLNKKKIFYGPNTVLCTGNPNLGSDIFN